MVSISVVVVLRFVGSVGSISQVSGLDETSQVQTRSVHLTLYHFAL